MQSRRMVWWTCAALIGGGAALYALGQTQTAPAETITDLEQQLWREATGPSRPTPTTQPYAQWFARAEQDRAAQLRAVRAYLTLYPGGAHRDEAIRLELAAMFDLAMLRGTSLDELARRATELLNDPPSDAARDEAAYWALVCGEAAEAAGPASQPADLAVRAQRLVAARRYLERCPGSPYAPRMAELVFEDALRRGDIETMRNVVELLARHLPDQATTRRLQGRLRLEESIGTPFSVRVTTTTGETIDTRTYRGRVVLIVVWAGFDAEARECALCVERFREQQPTVQVVGVSLDGTAERTAEFARELDLPWPQVNDGRGWGNELVTGWGLRGLPHVLVIGQDGRLLGVCGPEQWESLTRAALGESPASRPG